MVTGRVSSNRRTKAAKAANSPRKKKKVLDDVTATLHTDFSNQDIVISEVRRLSVSQQIKLDEEEEEEKAP